MNEITVVGNLVADPIVKTAAGQPLAKLRIATNDRVKDSNGQWKDGDTTFIDVTCWRKLAEGSSSLKKGQRVIVHGKLKGREYDRKDGSGKAYGYEIDASDVGMSILTMSSAPSSKATIAPDNENPWGE